MADNKIAKSNDQLLLENKDLKKHLAITEEALHQLRISVGEELETELSSVYDSMSDGLALHNLIYDSVGKPVDYSLIYVNPSYEKITGLSKTQVLGRRSTDVYSVKAAPFLDIYSEVIATGKPVSFDTFFAPMKKHFQVSVFSPAKDKFVTVFQDITERKQAEEQIRKQNLILSSVLDNVNSGVALIDETGSFVLCNPLFLKLFGLSEDSSVKNVNDQNWAEWKVFNEKGNLLHVDDHPVRKAAITGKRVDQQLVGVKLPSGGDIIWMLVSAEPIFKNNGKIENIICTYTDITKRKEAEQSLDFQSQLLSNVNDAVFSSDLKYTINYWNKAAERMFGWTEDEALGQNSGELLKPKIEGSSRNKERSKLRNAGHWEGETQYIRKDGTYFFADVISTTLTNENGKDTGNVVVARDITARKKIEIALQESEQRYRQMFDQHRTIGLLIEPESGAIIEANSAALKYYGYTSEQLCSLKIQDINLLPPDEVEAERKKAFAEHRNYFIFPHRLASGEMRWVEVYSSPLFSNGRQLLYSIIHDITSRKKAEESLQLSEERYRNLFSAMPSGVAVYEVINDGNDPEGKDFIFKDMNPAGEKIDNVKRTEIVGKSLFDFFPSVREMGLTDVFQRVWKTGEPEYFPVTLYTDNRISLWVNNYVWKLPSGELVALFDDITESKKVEQKLLESEERFRNLVKNAPTAIYEIDFQTRKFTSANDSMCQLSGYSREELLTLDVLDLLDDENRKLFLSRIKKSLKGEKPDENVEYRVRSKDGRIIDAILNMKFTFNEKGMPVGAMVVGHDITERKKAERELLKTTEALKESERNYKELVTNARSIILKFDNEANFTLINEYALNFFGYELNELLGKSVMTVVPKVESTGRDLDEMVDNILEDPDKYSININENIKKNGEKVWVEWHNKALFDKSGKKTGHIAIGVDITKRRIAEENLKESERKLRSVLNATLESIYMFDTNGIIWMANSTGIKRLNKTSESEVIGHHFSEFMTPEVTASRTKMHKQVIDECKPLEFEDERDHRTYHHSFSPVTNGDKVQFVVTYSTDITQRKNSELKLKNSEDRLRTIAESLTVMISITRKNDSITLFANDPYLKAFGFSSENVIGRKDPDIFAYPEDRKNVQNILKKAGSVDNHELKVKRSDGTEFWIITSIREINYMGDISFLASSIDITETKKTQEELVRLNRTLNAHSKSSQVMMQSDNEFSYLNEVCKIIIQDCGHSMVWVGYAQDDKNKTVSPVAYYGLDKGYIDQMNITWDDSDHGRGPTGTAIRTCRPSICKNMLTDPRFEPWREAAISRGFASSLVLPMMSGGKCFGAVSIYSKEPDSFSDSEIDLLNDLVDDLAHGITYLRLTESERAAARLIKENEAKLKELIVTKDKFFNIIAHDLKNPFTSLLGSSELLYDNINLMTKDNVKKLALILNDSAKGGYAILQNLLDWSRSQTGILRFCPQEINLRSIIEENIENFTLQTTNKEITMKSDMKSDNIIIRADKNMINTVLRNLLSNAVKFTHKYGYVTVNTDVLPDEIILSVIDTGVGMSQDKIDQLFQLENSLSMPGTEKEQGTGLGLKLCKEFTEIMGGRIWAESKLGEGSRFCFTIPLMKMNKNIE